MCLPLCPFYESQWCPPQYSFDCWHWVAHVARQWRLGCGPRRAVSLVSLVRFINSLRTLQHASVVKAIIKTIQSQTFTTSARYVFMCWLHSGQMHLVCHVRFQISHLTRTNRAQLQLLKVHLFVWFVIYSFYFIFHFCPFILFLYLLLYCLWLHRIGPIKWCMWTRYRQTGTHIWAPAIQ